MKKLALRKICSLLLACSMLLSTMPGTMAGAKPRQTHNYAARTVLDDPLHGETGVVSITYDAMDYEGEKPLNQKDHLRWRESMVTGNGEIALLESCNPLSDVMIFQNTKFNMPNNDRMDTPAIYQKLDEMRQAMVKDPYAAETEGTVWKLVEEQAKESWGIDEAEKWACGYDYSYHPGNQLRVDMEEHGEMQDYKRWTNYEKAEIGVGYEDEAGVWLRRTFASRADNVIITEYTQSSEGEKLDLTLSLDDISSIPRESGTTPDVRYKELVPEDASFIGQVVHYPIFENSFLNKGGYAGMTRVLTDGQKEKVELEPTDKKNIGEKAAIRVTGAEKVILITALDRTVDTLGTMEEFAQADTYALVDELCSQIAEVEEAYSEADDEDSTKDSSVPVAFSYDDALAAHVEIHRPLFNGVKLDLHGDEADRSLPNEALLKKQRSNKSALYPAMIERAFNAGRYAAVCASGYSTTRLGGIWTGVFNPNWQADYTTDANVNLQISAANVGSMKTFGRGYIDFMLRIVDDFQYNAEQIYGMEDAIMASGRTDGENGFIYHFNAGNPFFCWNAGADWQLLPIYEYWQCYGNETIPVGADIDVESLAEVLDLDAADIERVKKDGFDLEEDILWPLLRKHAHFWEQFVDPQYYMDAQGNTCYDPDHKELAEGERYMLLPTYSPENHPKKPNEDVVQINSTMDIAAARDGLDMAIAMAGAVGDTTEVEKWQELKAKLPAYKYQEQGDLMEWSIDECANRENYGHRHFSHLYPVWPGYEAEDNMELKAGADLTMAYKARDGQNSQQSHGWMHKGLGEARLKNGQGVIDSLKPGMTGKIYHSSMTTAHNVNGSSAYCTDTQIGMVGIVQEALLFSRTGITTDGFETENDGNCNGEIELLPALPEDWEEGSITGLHARTQAVVDSLEWSRAEGEIKAEITSNTDQTIALKCGVAWETVTVDGKTPTFDENGDILLSMEQGETVAVVFTLSEVKDGDYVVQSGEKALTVQAQNRAENGVVSTAAMKSTLPDNALWVEFPTEVYDDGSLPAWKTPGVTAGYLNASTKVSLCIRGNNWADSYGEVWSWGAGASLDPAGLSQLRLTDAGDGYVYIETYQEWKGDTWDGVSQKVLTIHPEAGKICNTVKSPSDNTQKWKRIVTETGYVAFQNRATGAYLSAEKMDTNGDIVTISAEKDYGRHQIWKLSSQQGGGVQLVNAGSGRALAVQDGKLVQKVQGTIWKLSPVTGGYAILTADGTKGISADGTLVDAEKASSFQFTEKETTIAYYPIDTVKLQVPSDTLQVGKNMQVSAQVEASGISGANWISLGVAPLYLVENGIGVATIDKNGNLKALREGDVTVIAMCKMDPSTRAEQIVHITAEQPTYSKEELAQLVEQAKQLLSGDYTAESLAELEVAISSAEAALANPESSVEEYTGAYLQLQSAIDRLVEEAPEPETHAVHFVLTPASASVTVKNVSGQVVKDLNALTDGVYTYSVSASGYNSKSGSFTMAGKDMTVTVTLSKKSSGGSHSSSPKKDTDDTVPVTQTSTTTVSGNVVTPLMSSAVISGNIARIQGNVDSAVVQNAAKNAASAVPFQMTISVPASNLAAMAANEAIEILQVEVTIPSTLTSSGDIRWENMQVAPALLNAAKTSGKELVVIVKDETGKEQYRLQLSGKGMQNSPVAASSMNFAGSVSRSAQGATISLKQVGPIPGGVATVILAGFAPNTRQYVYALDTSSGFNVDYGTVAADAAGSVKIQVVAGGTYAVLSAPAAQVLPVKSDTRFPVPVKKGSSYTYKMTVTGTPELSLSTGNASVFTGMVAKRVGNDIYFTVQALGKAGDATGIYCTIGGKAVQLGMAVVTE